MLSYFTPSSLLACTPLPQQPLHLQQRPFLLPPHRSWVLVLPPSLFLYSRTHRPSVPTVIGSWFARALVSVAFVYPYGWFSVPGSPSSHANNPYQPSPAAVYISLRRCYVLSRPRRCHITDTFYSITQTISCTTGSCKGGRWVDWEIGKLRVR